jgi:hypothetical protein
MNKVSHPNILTLLGACYKVPLPNDMVDPESDTGKYAWAMVTEFMTCDLAHFLYSRKKDTRFDLRKKFRFAFDIAAGLSWLQGKSVGPSSSIFLP